MESSCLSLSLSLSLSNVKSAPMGTVNLAAAQVSPNNFRTSDFLTKYRNQELQI
jgi:hypothetical protein